MAWCSSGLLPQLSENSFGYDTQPHIPTCNEKTSQFQEGHTPLSLWSKNMFLHITDARYVGNYKIEVI